jgi:hypothetical protein
VARRHDQAFADGQEMFRPSGDGLVDPDFQAFGEEPAVGQVDAAVHEAVAVGRRHDGVVSDWQDTALLDGHLRQIGEGRPPSGDERGVGVNKVQVHPRFGPGISPCIRLRRRAPTGGVPRIQLCPELS